MLLRWMKRVFQSQPLPQKNEKSFQNQTKPFAKLDPSLSNTLSSIREAFKNSPDFVVREFAESAAYDIPLAVCYIEGLTDPVLLVELMEHVVHFVNTAPSNEELRPDDVVRRILPTGHIENLDSPDLIYRAILTGHVVVLVDGERYAIAVPIPGGARRSVEEPTSQTVVRGPKEGFTEEINTNMTLIRRKIRTPDLKFQMHHIGDYTQTSVAVAYIQGIAKPEVVAEVTKRLSAIHTDSILESGYIEEFIQDAPITPFPTLINTERPDTVAGSLLDGQVAILVDGTPFALIGPVTFFNFFQTTEDYYQRYDISTFLRAIRLMSFLVSLLLPSTFIALTTFQQEMIPTTLLITLAAQREGVPFPALLEALLMEITFEVIREAGVRMPRAIGPAISIVGALVIGQAAVEAGLVSGAMVIVVSFTAISNFVIPYFSMATAVRLMRFPFMLLAGTLGLFGILVGAVPLLVHLISLKSLGVDYMMPFSPFYKSNMKDLILRVPWWAMKTRPNGNAGPNKTKQSAHQYPLGSNNAVEPIQEPEPDR
ncbi:spore germination protein [Paenibacillus sp. CC-CFT742]|uniref:spore germination protein n=1 Tax=Paenibacillus TaxID=44249 RepID=UPI00203B9425|nr:MULTISPECIES: spore germination protein [Paenibacillus]MCM3203054.1 spore germination protein [Paenibacillus illinoisensis]WJH29614.1 spore germination protein [Paenibacillus sp. CC-CFT742]